LEAVRSIQSNVKRVALRKVFALPGTEALGDAPSKKMNPI